MPKKTTPRIPGPDEWAAERIRHERELRNWSTAELARRVTESGVALRQQQVWQIESGNPPRKLSVGEAAAFAKVFGLTIADLLVPPEDMATQNLIELGRAFATWRRDAGVLAARLREIAERASQLESSDEERYVASVAVKFSAYDDLAEPQAREFDEIAKAYADIAQEVRNRNSVWSMIASMRELVAVEETAAEPTHAESIRHHERKNPSRKPKSGGDT